MAVNDSVERLSKNPATPYQLAFPSEFPKMPAHLLEKEAFRKWQDELQKYHEDLRSAFNELAIANKVQSS